MTPTAMLSSLVDPPGDTERGLLPGPSLSHCESHPTTLQWVWGLAGHCHLLGASKRPDLRVSSYGVQRLIQVPLPTAVETVEVLPVVVPLGGYRSQTFWAGLKKHHDPTSFHLNCTVQVFRRPFYLVSHPGNESPGNRRNPHRFSSPLTGCSNPFAVLCASIRLIPSFESDCLGSTLVF